MGQKPTKAQLRQLAMDYAGVIRAGAPLASDRSGSWSGRQTAIASVAKAWGVIPDAARKRLLQARRAGLAPIWEKAEVERREAAAARIPLKSLPAGGPTGIVSRRVVLLTAAQDETPLHGQFWANLEAYRVFRKAELMIGGFTYQKGLFEDHSVRAGVYAAEIVPHLRPAEIGLAPKLIWCGQANILPTASQPLTGWQTHGGPATIVVPHAKIALEAVAAMPGEPAKLALSTGVCTLPNYIKRNAGMKAEWHHTIGFAVCEIEPDGTFYVRTVSAEKDGAFQDLDLRVSGSKVKTGCRVEAITWGDIHHEKLDPAMSRISWGIDPSGRRPDDFNAEGMVDVLRPKFQFFHDLIDFTARSHHNRSDPAFLAQMHAARTESVAAEIAAAAKWLNAAHRHFCRSVVVDSNHNDALLKWLRSPDGQRDPANSPYWHAINAAWHAAVVRQDFSFHPFEHALRQAGAQKFEFVRAGASFSICGETAPVECGLHGHRGPNGGRGSAAAFARLAPRVNVAHSHSPAIREACYSAGVNGRLLMGYNTGPSAWAPADIVTFASGKRQIVVKTAKGWRGGR